MNQKEFLLELEQICGIKKPLFLDTKDSWNYPEDKLKRAKDLTNLPVIGRYRLTPENSEVSELWFDLEIPEDEKFSKLAELALKTLKLIKTFGITQPYIYIKLSGHGIHIQVFISGLRDTKQLLLLAKVIHQKLPMSKQHSLGSDSRCLVDHQKIREFGGENGEHYTTAIVLKDLKSAKRKKTYPINKKADAVVYPKIKVFECTPQMIRRIHELEAEFELEKETETYGSEVDYDKDGEIKNLYNCFTIARLAKKVEEANHLTHAERLAVCQTFICFGQDGQDEIHKILSKCTDYDKDYTQWVINDNKKRGYRPFTCQWIKDHVGCPEGCKGSGGKSPFKFAWGSLPLKDVLIEYEKVLVLHPNDRELLEVCMAAMLDARMKGDLAWLFLIAPSSSGKTVIINSLYNPLRAIKKDFITDKTLVSGKTYRNKAGEEVPIEGLLPKLNNKTLLIKEFTTQLMHGETMRNSIFGQLRAIYDEEYDVAFGSFDCAKIPESWKHVRMGLVAGCTPFIDRYSTLNVILGERYLKIRMTAPDRVKAALRSLDHAIDIKSQVERLRKKVTRFLENIEVPQAIVMSQELKLRLVHLSEFVVLTRKPVTIRDSVVGLKIYEADEGTEMCNRLVKQLGRLGQMIASVRDTKWDEAVFRTIGRIAFDTLPPSRAAIVKYLYGQTKPTSAANIQKALNWGQNRTASHLKKLLYIHVIDEVQNVEYVLNPQIRYHLNITRYLKTAHTKIALPHSSNITHIPDIHNLADDVKITDFNVEKAYAAVDDNIEETANFKLMAFHLKNAFSAECENCRMAYKPEHCLVCFKRGFPVAPVRKRPYRRTFVGKTFGELKEVREYYAPKR